MCAVSTQCSPPEHHSKMSESEFLLLATPVLAVKGAICFRCLKVASRLDRCSRCKRVLLVGAIRQMYPADKYVCTAIARRNVRKRIGGKAINSCALCWLKSTVSIAHVAPVPGANIALKW